MARPGMRGWATIVRKANEKTALQAKVEAQGGVPTDEDWQALIALQREVVEAAKDELARVEAGYLAAQIERDKNGGANVGEN